MLDSCTSRRALLATQLHVATVIIPLRFPNRAGLVFAAAFWDEGELRWPVNASASSASPAHRKMLSVSKWLEHATFARRRPHSW